MAQDKPEVASPKPAEAAQDKPEEEEMETDDKV